MGAYDKVQFKYLNSARNEILFNVKWEYLEQELAYNISKGIYENVDIGYWVKLKEILLNETKSENFIKGLKDYQRKKIKLRNANSSLAKMAGLELK